MIYHFPDLQVENDISTRVPHLSSLPSPSSSGFANFVYHLMCYCEVQYSYSLFKGIVSRRGRYQTSSLCFLCYSWSCEGPEGSYLPGRRVSLFLASSINCHRSSRRGHFTSGARNTVRPSPYLQAKHVATFGAMRLVSSALSRAATLLTLFGPTT